MGLRIIIEQVRTYSNQFKVWRQGGTAGPMMAEMGAKICHSQEEVLEEVKRLLPIIDVEVEKKIDEAEAKLIGKDPK
jgi:hypothetical protein